MGRFLYDKWTSLLINSGFYMSNIKNKRTGFWTLMGQSLAEMRKNDPLRMAGATSFFTTFALPPILIILFQLFTLFLSRRYVGAEMAEILSETFGKESANQIRITTRGFRSIAHNWYTAAAGFLFLLFVATTLFTVIKNTLNDIWNIRVKDKPGPLVYFKLRGRSLLIMLFAGLLFLAGLLLDGLEVLAGKYIENIVPQGSKQFFNGALNEVMGVLVVAVWFILLFRYLADARPAWKIAIAGGCLTGILFSAGQALLSFLILKSNIGTIYGAGGSVILLLLFVFYSSFILYFGAGFIKVYAEALNKPLRPLSHAFHYKLQELAS
jgi:membrane protein